MRVIEILITAEKQSGKTQGEIAREAGLTPTELSDKLAGRKPFTEQDIIDLAPVLGTKPAKLMGEVSRTALLALVQGREKKLTQAIGKPPRAPDPVALPDYTIAEDNGLTPILAIDYDGDDAVKLDIWPQLLAASPPDSPDRGDEGTVSIPKLQAKRRNTPVWPIRVSGRSMVKAGVEPGDVVFARRASSAKDGDIVIAALDGGVTLKRKKGAQLIAESDEHSSIDLVSECDLKGVVHAIHKPQKK